jgi:hypothetical protein
MSVNSYQYVCEPESDDLNICAMCIIHKELANSRV